MSLIIPMRVEALLSDGIDVHTKRIPQAAPDYSCAWDTSCLGSNSTPIPLQSLMPPLKQGVHLHFILPDFLKQGDDRGRFPALPDRYLVTRLLEKQGRMIAKQWVIESNFISLDDAYADSVTIPYLEDEENRFRYCGRAYAVGEEPEDCGSAEYLDCLTALGGGDPMFTAYYPSCSSLFGFHDPMQDVAEGQEVAYLVTGFFSDLSQDPFAGVENAETFDLLLQRHGLSVSDADRTALPDRSVLFGLIHKICWTRGAIPVSLPEGDVSVSLGNTSQEALSAAVQQQIRSENPFFQRFFTGLQYGEIEKLEEPDGEWKLDDEIFLRQFQRIDGANGTFALCGSDVENEALASEFSKLLREKQELGVWIRRRESEKNKLHCLWEQYIMCCENEEENQEQGIAEDERAPSLKAFLEEISRISNEIDGLTAKIQRRQEALESARKPIISEVGEAPFYRPKEPALLLYGKGVNRSYAFGENGRFSRDRTLLCQTAALNAGIEISRILELVEYRPASLLECHGQLLVQALLLIPRLRKTVEKTLGKLEVSGEISPLVGSGQPNSFVTLFMDWQMQYYPLRSSGDTEPDDTLNHCRFDHGQMDFTTEEAVGSRMVTYRGRSIITPHATVNLKQRLLQWMNRYGGGEEVRQACELLDTLPVLSQSLGGLNEHLSARMQAYQFPIMGLGGDAWQVEAVQRHRPDDQTSIRSGAPLFPLRGGHFRMEEIQLAGTFGQRQQVLTVDGKKPPELLYSETIAGTDSRFGYLHPGFMTPSRLQFDWLDREGQISSEAAGTSPVIGWVIPELMHGRLILYDAAGAALGQIKKVLRNGQKAVRWVSAPGLPRDLSLISMEQTLYRFVQSLLEHPGNFPAVFQVIEAVLEKQIPKDRCRRIWGNALALARAQVCLEFFGEPEFTKDISSFRKYNTLGVETVSVPLAMGDMERKEDGLAGVFVSDRFDDMIPPFGFPDKERAKRESGGYVRYGETLTLSADEGKRELYLLLEAGSVVYLQTGLHPVKSAGLYRSHRDKAEELALLADLYPLLTREGEFQTFLQETHGRSLLFEVQKQGQTVSWPLTPFGAGMEKAVICEGRLAERKGGTSHGKQGSRGAGFTIHSTGALSCISVSGTGIF